jgi:hypothetical protein
MSDAIIHSLVFHAALIGFVWAPFAVAAFVVEHVGAALDPAVRGAIAHPVLAWRARHPAHA